MYLHHLTRTNDVQQWYQAFLKITNHKNWSSHWIDLHYKLCDTDFNKLQNKSVSSPLF